MKISKRIHRKFFAFFCLLLVFTSFSPVRAEDERIVSIRGDIKHLLELTMEDLTKFDSATARLNEVTRDRQFHGAFTYTGVPLRTLLEIAVIEKGKTDFAKPIDLAIIVENKQGEKVALSWGEIFYRNPAEILIAYTALPVMPHKSCQSCHTPAIYEQRLSEMTRQVKLPKLVVASDFYTDRCIEGITNITVIDLRPEIEIQKQKELFSEQFTVAGHKMQPFQIQDLSSFHHEKVTVKMIGDGKGYHGLHYVEGVFLSEILSQAGMKHEFDTVVLVSAPDGYRTLLSYGEIFLNARRNRSLLADRIDQEAIRKNGRFILFIPDDLSADRWVKAVDKIEIKKVILR